ncbi:MAG TPA: hypothetical protein VJR89_26285 [Polyangiales bacterium]|nr:hypothetical protein [Polyangiales bacterium]
MNVAHSALDRRALDRIVRGALDYGSRRGFRARWRAFLDDVEAGGLAPRAFTCVLPLEPLTAAARLELPARLRGLNGADSPLLEVFGVRRVRCSVLENTPREAPHGALVFSCLHEGEREEVLYELLELPGAELDRVLRHCRDYPGGAAQDACVRMLMARAVTRNAAKLVREPVRVHLDRQHDGWLDRLRRHVRDGLHLLAPPAANDPREQLPNLEDAPGPSTPEATLWARRSALVVRHALRRKKREALRADPCATIRRGFHTKHHGLVEATFVVSKHLPAELARGVFQPGRRYPARMRLSNMTGKLQRDAAGDARGLAIQLEGIGQDFLLASHPVFVTKDARDYTLLNSFLMARKKFRPWLRSAVFVSRRMREVGILLRVRSFRTGHPLGVEYHSMTAYAFGNDAVKYLVRPCEQVDASLPLPWCRSADFLRDRLRSSLQDARAPLKLEFCLVLPDEHGPLPLDDARADWSERAHVEPVATIEIDAQDPCTPERMRAAEEMVFSPWHAWPEHLPLGSLARARFAVYRESVAQRTRRVGDSAERAGE